MMDDTHVPYRVAAAYLLKRLQNAQMAIPSVGIICGSGLSELSETFVGPTLTVAYAEIPGFPSSCTVAGHKGEVVFGTLSGVPALCFRGRFHSYEGHDMKTVVLPVYVMRCLNVSVCLVTNAAGGLNPEYAVGDIVAVSDHLALPQLVGNNPLVGPNDDELGPRFPATSNAYDETLRTIAHRAAQRLGIADSCFRTHGTYCFVSGPMYESKAECRFLRLLGGDMVGMSTIPEIVAAHHCNMKPLCLSLITNQVVMGQANDKGTSTSSSSSSSTTAEVAAVATHAEVLAAVAQRSKLMQQLVTEIVATVRDEFLPHVPVLTPVVLDVTNNVRRPAQPQWNDWYMRLVAGGALVGLGAVLATALVHKTRR